MSDEILQQAVDRFEELNKEGLEKLRKEFRQFKEYFEREWQKKPCRWFFKKYRRKKLWAKLWHGVSWFLFPLVEDIIKDTLTHELLYGDYITSFVDIKDMSVGTKAGYNGQVIIDEFRTEQGGGLYLYGENKIRNYNATKQDS